MNEQEKPYDKTSVGSILEHALKLKKKSLNKYAKEKGLEQPLNEIASRYVREDGKGNLGNIVQEFHFGIRPNSRSEPDFVEVGLELKTAPTKINSKGQVAKERVVLNIINYKEEDQTTFESSSFYKKNAHLLFMFYLYKKEDALLDYVFQLIRTWKFDDIKPEDKKIIMDDWKSIVNKIAEGRAHEISEGDTLYLGACTKGARAETNFVEQYVEGAPSAQQRAYSLKYRYVNSIIKEGLNDSEPVIKSINEYVGNDTFEDLIIKKFQPYYQISDDELFRRFNIESTAKSKYHLLAKAILGVTKDKIAEFEKAEIMMKTVRLGKKGTPKEHMSFAQIKYDEIVEEEWESSYWYDVVVKRFFFVVFQKNSAGKTVLKKVLFWNMPYKDIEEAKIFWEETKTKVINDDFGNFRKIIDKNIFHIRPKAKNKADMASTKFGKRPKLCYWINALYIKKAVAG